jgi:hypothetical protein
LSRHGTNPMQFRGEGTQKRQLRDRAAERLPRRAGCGDAPRLVFLFSRAWPSIVDPCPDERLFFAQRQTRPRIALESRRAHRVGIKPLARGRGAPGGGALQAHPVAAVFAFEHEKLPPRYFLVATLAEPLVVERMPEAKFVQESQDIEPVIRRKLERRTDRHLSMLSGAPMADNRFAHCRFHQWNPDCVLTRRYSKPPTIFGPFSGWVYGSCAGILNRSRLAGRRSAPRSTSPLVSPKNRRDARLPHGPDGCAPATMRSAQALKTNELERPAP